MGISKVSESDGMIVSAVNGKPTLTRSSIPRIQNLKQMQKISLLNQGANDDFMLAMSAESMLNSMYLRPTPTAANSAFINI